jgi:hypothetical protein
MPKLLTIPSPEALWKFGARSVGKAKLTPRGRTVTRCVDIDVARCEASSWLAYRGRATDMRYR